MLILRQVVLMLKAARAIKLFFILFFALLFMASQWQLEIADNCLLNGWQFRILFNWFGFDDIWAVRDFWMLLMDIAFLGEALTIFLARSL